MNVNVITRHGPSNYGSLLQSIATVKVIESLGHDCRIIDYQRKDERGLKSVVRTLGQKKEWSDNILKKTLYIALRWPSEALAQMKFDKWRRRFLPLTKRFYSKNDLSQLEADFFVTGSDQVWGPIGSDPYDDAYFLSFVKEGKKVALASSFGRTAFTDSIKDSFYRLLERYDFISVRENSAIDIINGLGIETAGQVLDPTLLIERREWLEFVKPDEKFPKGKYILIYQIHNDPRLNIYASNVSKQTGLPVYRVSPSLHQITRGGKFIFAPDISRFLTLINNAGLMITDSFHGTAFAINLNTPFIDFLPENGTKTRNQSILELTGLTGRIAGDVNDMKLINEAIDFERVNKIIDKQREVSLDIIRQMFSSKQSYK